MATPNIYKSAQKEQSEFSCRPRHPYAFCQCEGDDCSECLLEEKEQIGQLLIELAALRKRRARIRNLTPFAPRSILPLPISKD